MNKATMLAGLALGALLSHAAAAAAPRVTIETTLGSMTLELDESAAPQTVANFLQYAGEGFYAGTIFHRVIADFMIQGGGFTEQMQQRPTRAPVQNEANNGLRNTRGSIAMARTGDPHSATAQFFINTVDNAFLDYPGQDGWGYAVFGRVIEGMDVVDRIRAVDTGRVGPFTDVPTTPVVITGVTILAPAASN